MSGEDQGGPSIFRNSTLIRRTPPQLEISQNKKKRKEETSSEVTPENREDNMEKILKDIWEELKQMREEARESRGEITKLTKLLESEKEERGIMEQEITFLKKRITTLEESLERRDNAERRNNIIVRGVEETEEEDESKTKCLMENIYRDKLEIDPSGIMSARRLGEKRGNYPRPVLISMMDLKGKINVMKQRSRLRGTRIFLEDDYSTLTRDKRRKMLNIVRDQNVPRREIKLRGDKILIGDKMYQLAMERGEECLIEMPARNKIQKNLMRD